MYRILKKKQLVPNIHLMVIESDTVPKNTKPGEFVVVRTDETGERIPLNVVDWTEKTLSVVFMEVGTSTRKLACLKPGDGLATLAGPLGRPTVIPENKSVLAIAGCYGIGAIYPVIREFRARQNRVTSLIEGRTEMLLYWQPKLRRHSERLIEMTRDGSRGVKGHINDFLPGYLDKNPTDLIYCQGCTYLTYLVSQLTRPLGVKTIVGLNPIMIDATGMCGVCRVIVNNETKFACVDGPEFDGHQVNWENLLSRRHTYLEHERRSLSFLECERYG
jgi:ferredoxin--NADP+ reductase